MWTHPMLSAQKEGECAEASMFNNDPSDKDFDKFAEWMDTMRIISGIENLLLLLFFIGFIIKTIVRKDKFSRLTWFYLVNLVLI